MKDDLVETILFYQCLKHQISAERLVVHDKFTHKLKRRGATRMRPKRPWPPPKQTR